MPAVQENASGPKAISMVLVLLSIRGSRANFAATDTAMSDRRHQSHRSDSIGTRSGLEQLFAGLMIVAAVQAGTSTAPYVRGRPMWADQLQVCRIVETFSDVLQRGLAARS